MADILSGLGPGLVGGRRAAKEAYRPLEAKYPAYIPQIDKLSGEGLPEDQIEVLIVKDMQRRVDEEGLTPDEVRQQTNVPAKRSIGGQAKNLAKTLYEAISQPGTPEGKERFAEGLVHGATLGYYDPNPTEPTTRQGYVAKEAGRFVGGGGQGVNIGSKISSASRALIGVPATFLGRTAAGTAEGMAANIVQTGASQAPDLASRGAAVEEMLTDPLNLLLTGGGAAVGAKFQKPAPKVTKTAGPVMDIGEPLPTRAPTPPAPAPTAPGRRVTDPMPRQVLPTSRLPEPPAAPRAEPTVPQELYASEAARNAQTLREQHTQTIKEAQVRQADLERRQTEALQRGVDPANDARSQDIALQEAAQLGEQVEAEQRKILAAERMKVRLSQPRTRATPAPGKTITLGGNVYADPTPPGAEPKPPLVGDDTILNAVKNDILLTGRLSDSVAEAAGERANRSMYFKSRVTNDMIKAETEFKERKLPPALPTKPTEVGVAKAKWVMDQIEKGFLHPNLGTLTDDEINAARGYLRTRLAGSKTRTYTDRLGKPVKFVLEGKKPETEPEGRPFKQSMYQALEQLEAAASDRGIWDWGKVPLSEIDAQYVSEARYHGSHPKRGHRVELIFSLPEGKNVSMGDIWISHEDYPKVDWRGKLKYGTDRSRLDLTVEEEFLQYVADTVRTRHLGETPKARPSMQRPGVPVKPEKMPPFASLADVMRATGWGRDMAERAIKALVPEAPTTIVRDPALVERMERVVDSLKRKGQNVQHLETERAQLDGYSPETLQQYGIMPEEVIPPPPGVVEYPPRVPERERMPPSPMPEGRPEVQAKYRAEAEAKAAEEARKPYTHQVAIYHMGEFVDAKDFRSLAEAEEYFRQVKHMAEVTGAENIGGEVRAYAPYRKPTVEPAAPVSAFEEMQGSRQRPGRPARRPAEEPVTTTPSEAVTGKPTVVRQRRQPEAVTVPVRPEEAIPRPMTVLKRSDVRDMADQQGYTLSEPSAPGTPYVMRLHGPEGRFDFDDMNKAAIWLQNKAKGTGATATDFSAVVQGEKPSASAAQRIRGEQNVIRPNAVRNPQPIDVPPEAVRPPEPGPTLGMFVGVPPMLPRVFSSPDLHRRMAPAYGAIMRMLAQKGLGPQDAMNRMRHIMDVERTNPGAVNAFVEAAQHNILYDNPLDHLGSPQFSSNPAVRAVSTDALISNETPRMQEHQRQLQKANNDYVHLTPAQDRAAYLHMRGIQESRDPVVLQAVRQFDGWREDVSALTGLPSNWQEYLAGAADKQKSYTSMRNLISDFGSDYNNVPEPWSSWVNGPAQWKTFYNNIMKQDEWKRLPRDARDIVNKNWMTWEGSSASYDLLPIEMHDLVPPSVWHKFALQGGQPAVESLPAFQKALIPEIMSAVFQDPWEARWRPFFDLLEPGHPVRKWGDSYMAMVRGGAERSGITLQVDKYVRMVENAMGKAIADDYLLDNLANRANRNLYRGLLGVAPDSSINNSTSIIYNFAEYGPTRILKGLRSYMANTDDLRAYYEQTKNRTGIMSDVMWDLQYGKAGVPKDGNAFRNFMADKLGITRDRFDYADKVFTDAVMMPMHFTDNLGKGMSLIAALDEGLHLGLPFNYATVNALEKLATVRPDYVLTGQQQAAMLRTLKTQFGHLPSMQPTAFRNPLMRSLAMFWNYPSKASQLLLGETYYRNWRAGADPDAARWMRYAVLTGAIFGGVYAGKELGLNLARMFGAGMIPSLMSPVLQSIGNLYNVTLGDDPLPDHKWANTWSSVINMLAGVPTRWPLKAAGAYTAGQEGVFKDAYGVAQYETTGFHEMMRAFGIEFGEPWRQKEAIRLSHKEDREYSVARRNAIGRFNKSGGQDLDSVLRFNAEWAVKGSPPITDKQLQMQFKGAQMPKVYKIMKTPAGQRALEEMGATP